MIHLEACLSGLLDGWLWMVDLQNFHVFMLVTCACTCNSVVDYEIMGWTLETILTKFAVGTSPLVRQASCVWLLTILKLAGKHPDIQVSYTLLLIIKFTTVACMHA